MVLVALTGEQGTNNAQKRIQAHAERNKYASQSMKNTRDAAGQRSRPASLKLRRSSQFIGWMQQWGSVFTRRYFLYALARPYAFFVPFWCDMGRSEMKSWGAYWRKNVRSCLTVRPFGMLAIQRQTAPLYVSSLWNCSLNMLLRTLIWIVYKLIVESFTKTKTQKHIHLPGYY